MVIEAGEQVQAQAKASAAMAVSFLESAEDFETADDVFHQHPICGQSVVVGFLRWGERLFFAALMWGEAFGVEFSHALVAAVGQEFRVAVQMQSACFEEAKVVRSPLAASRRDDDSASVIDGDLAL